MSGRVCTVLYAGLLLCGVAGAQGTPSVLHSFSTSEGIQPNALIQGKDGLFYGTAASGGAVQGCIDGSGNTIGCGTAFRINADNSVSVLYNFTGQVDGGLPTGLIQGGDGYLYGTTSVGGASLTPSCADPSNPANPPAACCLDPTGTTNVGCGTVFRISPSTVIPVGQTIQPLYSFYTPGSNGAFPNTAAFPNPLVAGGSVTAGSTQSSFYGDALTCSICSANGMLFSLTSSGTSAQVQSVYDFAAGGSSLLNPNALIEASDGRLYGTAQLGGKTACMVPYQLPSYGCGGAFVVDPASKAEKEVTFSGPASTVGTAPPSDQTFLPDDVRPTINAIVRQPQHSLPTGGPWGFPEMAVNLTQNSDGEIYGTTLPVCASPSVNYYASSSCISDYNNTYSTNGGIFNPGTILQLTPSGSTLAAPTPDTLYSFTQSGDGGGSLTGLTMASDGKFYGSSGDFIFDFAPTSSAITTLTPLYATLNGANSSFIQGSDGNFYGVIPDNGSGVGEFFEVAPSSTPKGPIQLTFTSNPVNVGAATTLTWTATNAYSLSAQQCYAFADNGAPGGSSWQGFQQGAPKQSGFGASLSITANTAGSWTYALTCGGMESATITLTAMIPPLQISTTSLTGGTVNSPYSVSLAATGGITPYTWSLASGSSLPAGLQLSTSGTISGTPTQGGTFSFSVVVQDSESTPASATANLSITISVPPLQISTTTLAGGALNTPYSGSLAATGGIAPYTWSLASGSSLPPGLQLSAAGVISGTPTQGGTFSFTVVVNDSETTPASATANLSITISVPPPSVTANPSTINIASPGGTGSTALTFAHFSSSAFTVNCSGLSEASCNLTNVTATSATLVVTTTAPSTAKLETNSDAQFAWAWLFPAAVLALGPARRRGWTAMLPAVFLLLVSTACIGCGGGGGSPSQNKDPGTPAGTSTVSVTVTAGSQSAPLQITVNIG